MLTAEEKAEIAKQVANSIIEQSKGTRDLPAVTPAPAPERSDVVVGKSVAEGTGINIARYVMARYASQTTGRSTVDVLKQRGYHDVAKALSASTFSDGGSLVHPAFASEFIELLRNK